MKNTENYGFNLPEKGEFYNVDDFNENFEGIDGKLKEFEDGTTPVGNANKLGGKDASEYFTTDGGTINGNVNIGSANDGAQKRFNLINSKRRILLEVDTDGKAYLSDYTNNKEIISSTADGTNTFNGTATGNLPLDGGGTVKGGYVPLTLEDVLSQGAYIGFKGTSGDLGFFGFGTKDAPSVIMSDGATSRELLHSGNVGNYALPKNAPQLNDGESLYHKPVASGTNAVGSMFKNKNGDVSGGVVAFCNNGLIDNINIAVGTTSPWASQNGLNIGQYEIHWRNNMMLHTGNKPTGTYTGNGSADNRTVAVNGLGDVAIITNNTNYAIAIVTHSGYIAKKSDGTLVGGSDTYLGGGNLTIRTSSEIFNASGVTYTYKSL